MPVKVKPDLPAIENLKRENIFVMTDERAQAQDIRPLEICVLNLMPTKQTTEIQLLRLIGNSPLQCNVTFLHTATYDSKNTDKVYLNSFYKTFDEIKHKKFDGLMVTGAPVEKLKFEEVGYWKELEGILNWADKNVYSAFFICWASQAALYHYYGIQKRLMNSKISGVFPHDLINPSNPLIRGFDDGFLAPHSRNTEILREDIDACSQLEILAHSAEAGVYIAASKDLRKVFVTGHGEYDADTLHNEYLRDAGLGLDVLPPKHYYPGDCVGEIPKLTWRAHSMLLVNNWLNYCVYQNTPYDITKIDT